METVPKQGKLGLYPSTTVRYVTSDLPKSGGGAMSLTLESGRGKRSPASRSAAKDNTGIGEEFRKLVAISASRC